MKKIVLLAFIGIFSSQVVYPEWPDWIKNIKNSEDRCDAKAAYLRSNGYPTARKTWLEETLNRAEASLSRPVPMHTGGHTQLDPNAGRFVLVNPPMPMRMDGPNPQDNRQVEPTTSMWVKIKNLLGCCGCCESTLDCAIEHPILATTAATVCCAGCGLYLSGSSAAMTTGSSVAHMCTDGSYYCYACSGFGCCCLGKELVSKANPRTFFTWCADCAAARVKAAKEKAATHRK